MNVLNLQDVCLYPEAKWILQQTQTHVLPSSLSGEACSLFSPTHLPLQKECEEPYGCCVSESLGDEEEQRCANSEPNVSSVWHKERRAGSSSSSSSGAQCCQSQPQSYNSAALPQEDTLSLLLPSIQLTQSTFTVTSLH
ncbi:hypothetical protein CesoFtcFv8_001863 [Champsocephalus esox]|uniref:Uncharacterized protein n=1 Tax=Champsocephalus esox TaxID=159716 RepID=A0AAN8D308_9TELE|nr:hypothetical protein CesoFtcFv8_001863 [Champsocephalus esox]